MKSLGELKNKNKVFFICQKLFESGVVIDNGYITTQRKKKLKYTNNSLEYCIDKLLYELEYEAEEDEVSDMIVDYKHIFENELELIEEEDEGESEDEDEEESEEEDEEGEIKEDETIVNANDKNSFLVDALFKIKNK